MPRYMIVDTQTGQRLGRATYVTRRGAQLKADKLDLEYGAVRYVVRATEGLPSGYDQAAREYTRRND